MKPLKVTSDLLNVVLYTVFQARGFLFDVHRPMYLLFVSVLQGVRYVFIFDFAFVIII